MKPNRFKFRAWNKKRNVMEHDVAFRFFDDGSMAFLESRNTYNVAIEIDDLILMQSTGRTDRHGKEVFEGDIVYYRKTGKCGEIWWNDHSCRYVIDPSKGLDMQVESVHELMVIGNIYENLDLLR